MTKPGAAQYRESRRVERSQPDPSGTYSLGAIFAAVIAGLSVNTTGTVAYLATAGLVVAWLFSNPLRFRFDRTFWILTASLAWLALSTTWATYPNPVPTVTQTAALMGLLLLMRDVLRSAKDLILVAEGYCVGLIVVASRLLFGESTIVQGGTVERLTLEEFNVNYLGYAFAGGLAVNLLLFYIAGRKRLLLRIVSTAAAIIGIIVTDTRGAMVSGVLLVIWIVLSFRYRHPPLRSLVVTILTTSLLIFSGAITDFLLMFDVGERATGDLSGRLEIWPVARDLWMDSPLIGSGPLATVAAPGLGVQAHNVFLETAASQGIVGLILLIAQFFYILSPDANSRLTRRGAVVIGAYLVVSAPVYLSGVWNSALAAWVLLAMFSVAARLNSANVTRGPAASL